MFRFLFKKNVGKDKGLGLKLRDNRPYLAKYPLTADTIPSTETPVVIGIPWYSNFDSPQRDTLSLRYWIGRGKLGFVRGGHAICLKPYNLTDKTGYWRFYNQGEEGACVGFSLSRAMSLLNVEYYDARWLYKEAQLIDSWEETPPEEGTDIDAGCRILFNRGHRLVRIKAGGERNVFSEELLRGINAYRWASSVDDIHAALKNPVADKLGAIPLLNSWGLDYPHVVYMPDETADRVIFQEYGEAAVLTDR